MRVRLPHRVTRVGAALVVVAAVVAVGAGGNQAGAAASSAVTKSATVGRTYLDNGQTTTVDSRKVSVTVSQTQDLKSLQEVKVTWNGAKPTQGVAPDVNSDLALNEEYAFDLFECRGTGASTNPALNLSPETCWTQYATERFQSLPNGNWPAWRSDSAATEADRAAKVNVPTTLPQTCTNLLFGVPNQRWLSYVGDDGTSYAGGPTGCAGQPSEASAANASSLSLPSNETYGITAADGTGSANFTIFTGEDHQSLGCSSATPCSLVAVPIEGISCDPSGSLLPEADRPTGNNLTTATSTCETTGNFATGEPIVNGKAGQPAVDSQYWWSASNWNNRIVVPLTFAPPDDVCAQSTQAPELIYGSELMTQATTSWASAFCTNSTLFNWQEVQTPEPEARTALIASTSLSAPGSVKATLGSQPLSGAPEPVVNAPVALTGFGIAFDVDGADGNPITDLKLDPRLIAKLLTESYPDETYIKNTYPASADGTTTLSTNPLNITDDPEFQALNPGVPVTSSDAASSLLILNSDSDVLYALTSYIEADPAARAWLDGEPDPWGMRVNPNYEGIALPTQSWPLLDTYQPTAYYASGINPCLQYSPQPYLPLIAAPQSRLFSIAQDMQFAIAQQLTACQVTYDQNFQISNVKLGAAGRQVPGHRFMLGLVALSDASRYSLSTADLQTQSTVTPPTRFSSAAGQTYVAASTASMVAAAKTLTLDSSTNTYPVPYSSLRTVAANSGAYPGTMVVYAQVPTKGLPAADAAKYAQILKYAAGDGQTPGDGVGQLPDGYVPMTKANGLGGLASFTDEAATQVLQQNGGIPLSPTTPNSPPSGEVTEPTTSTVPSGDTGDTGTTGDTTPSLPTTDGSTSGGTSAKAPAVASTPATTVVASPVASITGGVSAGLPVLVILAIAAVVGAVVLLKPRRAK